MSRRGLASLGSGLACKDEIILGSQSGLCLGSCNWAEFFLIGSMSTAIEIDMRDQIG